MSITLLDFEGTNGANVTAGGVSGLSTATPGAGGTITYDNSHLVHGLEAMMCSPASGVGCFGQINFTGGVLAVEIPFYLTALPLAETWLFSLQDTASTNVVRVSLSTTGKFRVYDALGSVYIATMNFPVNQWVRIAVYATKGAGTGNLKADYYIGTSATPVEAGYSALGNANVGSNDFLRFSFGKVNASTYTTPLWVDAAQWDPAATDYIGAYNPNALTVDAGPDQVGVPAGQSVTLTATHPTGSTVTWSQVSGPPVDLT